MNVVYTAIFGKIDNLLRVNPAPGWRYVCFTDFSRAGASGSWGDRGWELKPAKFNPRPRLSPRRLARMHKVMSDLVWIDSEITLWVDGCLVPVVNPDTIVENHLQDHDIATFRHAQRSCVYQELVACLKLKKDDPGVMRGQIDRYRREGYPPSRGLGETTAVLRRHTPEVKRFNRAWNKEIQEGSQRDQLSFDYCCWKLSLEYAHLRGSRTSSPYFKHKAHR